MSEHNNRYEFLKKLGVGFDSLFEVVDNLGAEYFSEDYPPYNIVKTDADTYVIQLSMVGYSASDIAISLEDTVFTVKAKGSDKGPEAADDIFFHKGIKDGETYIKFLVSQGCVFHGALFEEGVLYLTYKVRKGADKHAELVVKDALEEEEKSLAFLPVEGKVKADRGGKRRLRRKRMGFRKYKYDSAGRPVAIMALEDEGAVDAEETEAVLKKPAEVVIEEETKVEDKPAAKTKEKVKAKAKAEAKSDVSDKKENKKPTKAERLAKKEEKKEAKKEEVTVEATPPEKKPSIVEAKVTKEKDVVKVEIEDATIEVSDDVELSVVKTPEGKADIVVAVDKASKEILETSEVDIVETVSDVVEAVDAAPELVEVSEETKTVVIDKEETDKPTVEVTVPVEASSVVEVKLDEKPTSETVPAIVIEDTAEDISETAELLPVVTKEGNPDIVVAIEPEVKEELETKEVDVVDVVEKAVAKVTEEIKTSEPVDEKKVEESGSDDVKTTEVTIDAEIDTTVVLVNKEDDSKPTVEVSAELDQKPAIVEVVVADEKSDVTDETAFEVVDATIEVSDDAKLEVIKTEEGKADVIVAVTPEVEKELEIAKVDAKEVVEAVVDAPEAPEAPVVIDEEGEVKEVENSEIVVLVDKTEEEKPTVEVSVDKVLPQIVEVTKVEPKVAKEEVAIEVKDTAENVSETVELIPVVTPEGQPDIVVAIEPELIAELGEEDVMVEEVVEKAINQADVIVSTPVVVEEFELEDASNVPEVIEKLDEIAKEPATIVVNETVDEKPTVEVTLAAEESPAVVEVKLDENPVNEEVPAIVIEDATIEVSDTAELISVETPENSGDVVVAIEPEVKEELEAKEVDVAEVVAEVLAINDAEPELVASPVTKEETVIVNKEAEDKTTVEVKSEVVIPQIVAVEINDDPVTKEKAIAVVDSSEVINPDAELVPVVTPEGQVDAVAAIEPEVVEEIGSVEEVKEVVEKALNQIDVAVEETPSTTVSPEEVTEASEVEEVVEKLEEIAKEPATILVDVEEAEPTVEVTLAAEEAPQIVEVKLDENPVSEDIPAIVVEDATAAVPADVVLIKAETAEEKSDVVIAIAPEVKEELEAKDVVVEEVVVKALEINDAEPELPTESLDLPVTEVKVDEVTVEVPEVITQIVEIEKENDVITISDSSPSIDEAQELVPVETPDDQPNVVAVVEKETAEEVVEVVEKALEEAAVEVETVVATETTVKASGDKAEAKTTKKKPVVIKPRS